jgi:acetylglutamate kinase
MIDAVVKLGGGLLEDRAGRARALAAVAARWRAGASVVLVHGGGRRIDVELQARGIPRHVCQGLRVTDAATLDVVVAILCGLVNKSLVSELCAAGVAAAGVCGADAGTLQAVPHPPVEGVDLGFVGRIAAARPALLRSLLREGYLPAVAPVASGPGGALFNVNADAAAAALAVSLGAEKLVFLTDVEGVTDARGRIVARLDARQAAELAQAPFVTGGMRPKLRACLEALEKGVETVVIAGPDGHEAAVKRGRGGTRLVAA